MQKVTTVFFSSFSTEWKQQCLEEHYLRNKTLWGETHRVTKHLSDMCPPSHEARQWYVSTVSHTSVVCVYCVTHLSGMCPLCHTTPQWYVPNVSHNISVVCAQCVTRPQWCMCPLCHKTPKWCVPTVSQNTSVVYVPMVSQNTSVVRARCVTKHPRCLTQHLSGITIIT